MSRTINHVALKQYALDFTTKILTDFYSSKATINGQEILALSPVRQVNLGIISRIFDQWKADTQRFRSPYFDFEKEEVKNTLQEFMNTVSRNIAIKQNDFQPLLLQSTEDALMLLLAPADYFARKLREMPNFVFDRDNAQLLSKYTHIHSGVAKGLSSRLANSNSDYVYANQALNWLSKTLDNGSALDDTTAYIQQFSSVLALDSEQLISINSEESAPESTLEKSVAETRIDGSFFDSTSPGTSQTPTPGWGSHSIPDPVLVEFRDRPTDTAPISTRINSLNSRFTVDMPAHADETNYGNVPVKVDSILGSIALGQRFMFVNQLFDKNSDSFDAAIRELEQAKTFEDARDLMSYKFASKYFWDMSSDAVNDLMALVKRKFN